MFYVLLLVHRIRKIYTFILSQKVNKFISTVVLHISLGFSGQVITIDSKLYKFKI